MIARFLLASVLALIIVSTASADDPDSRFHAAQEQLQNGNHEIARKAFDALRQEFPENVDYVFAYAIALIRAEELDAAKQQLDRAIQLAPNYEDIWRTRFYLLTRAPGNDQLEQARLESASRFPRATWWQVPPQERRYQWVLTAGAGYDMLDRDLPDWNNQFATLRFQPGDSRSYGLSITRNSRTRFDDISIGAAGDWQVGRWIAGVAATMSHDPNFAAENTADLFGGRQFGDGWVTTLRYRHQNFSNASVATVGWGLERYMGPFRLEYGLALSRLDGESDFSNHRLTANWYYKDASNIGITMYSGREIEAIGGGNVLETDVAGISISGKHELTERYSVQWWLGTHDQGDLYRRQFLGLAVSHRF